VKIQPRQASNTTIPPTKPIKKLAKRAPGATGADPAKAVSEGEEMRYTGKGIKVGVIDTGVYLGHPGINGRVVFGKSYHSGCTQGQDVNGHGTHVAGIIGAQDDFYQGVAPDVVFGVYNVFPCKGEETDRYVTDDFVYDALNDAVTNKMDIINLSLGSIDSEEGFLGQVASAVYEEYDILVISSHGNHGKQGLFSGTGPAAGRNAIATGACVSLDSTKENKENKISHATDSLKGLGFSVNDIKVHKGTLDWEKQHLTTLNTEDESEFCKKGSAQSEQFKGKVVVLSSGGCDVHIKTQNLADSGAIGLLFSVGDMNSFQASLSKVKETFPISSIRSLQGKFLRKKLVELPSTLKSVAPKPARKFSKNSASFDFKCDDIAPFSSWGPSPEFGIKPEITAPVSRRFASLCACR
jgi:subtilisin family serine protease